MGATPHGEHAAVARARTGVIARDGSWIVGEAIEQLERVAGLPGVVGALGMPDLHPGRDAPIGAAVLTDGVLYPHLVGSDIGCGMALWGTDLEVRRARPERLVKRLRHLDDGWDGDVAPWLVEAGLEPGPADDALGTIGRGNHFVELQVVDEVVDIDAAAEIGIDADAVLLLVHSGSRGLGQAIFDDHIAAFGNRGLDAVGADGLAYRARHDEAMAWATVNRRVIARRFLDALQLDGRGLLDLTHNSVLPTPDGSDRWVHRKGAAPSDCGPVVIPGSRGAHSYVVRPIDPGERSGWSVAHGAGRKWSRTDARSRLRERVTVEQLKRTRIGSHVICEDRTLLYEEAPEAYKDIDAVIGDLVGHELVEVVAILRPIVSYKTRTEDDR